MAKTNLIYNENPFKKVAVTGWVLAPDGTKMSKSKGTTVSPQEIVDKYSNDSLRYAAAVTKLGQDQPFQEKEVQNGIRIANKLFNANKFASMLLKGFSEKNRKTDFKSLKSIDKWILSKMQNVIKKSTQNFENYDYSFARATWEQFFMNDIADNYLEIVKQRLWQPDNYGKNETLKAQKALYHSLLNSLKGLSPIIPFITEEVYQNLYKQFEKEESIHVSNWPKITKEFVNDELVNLGDQFVEIVAQVRKFKSEKQVSMKEELSKIIIHCDKNLKEFIEDSIEDLKAVTSCKKIEFKVAKNLKIDIKK